MNRNHTVLALLLATAACPARAGEEEEIEVNVQSGRRAIEADPLVLPQWRAEDQARFAAGHPVNLGGGLWSEERYPLEPPAAGPPVPATTEAEAAAFVRAVDLNALAQGPWSVASAASPGAAERAKLRGPAAIRRSLLIALQVFLGGGAWWGLRLAWRRSQRPLSFRFPEAEAPARLGGAHCGGSGAVLRW